MLNVLANGHNLESFKVQCPMSILNLERNKAKPMNVTLLLKKNKRMSEDERTTGSVFSDPWIQTALTKRLCIRMDIKNKIGNHVALASDG